jgi:hypothetical protein
VEAGPLASLRAFAGGSAIGRRGGPNSRMSRVAHKLTLLAALLALAVPAIAQASPEGVIRDCAEDGDLDRKYSNGDLKRAGNNLPTDLDEYSGCREAIAGAIDGGSDKGRGRGGGPTASKARAQREAAARQADAAALDALTGAGKKPSLSVGGQTVEPGESGLFNLATAANSLPLPLFLALIAALALAAVAGAVVLFRRYPALAERFPVLSKASFPRVRLPRLRR